MTGGNYSLTGGFWALDFCYPNTWRADALCQSCRQRGDSVLAGGFRLEPAAEQ